MELNHGVPCAFLVGIFSSWFDLRSNTASRRRRIYGLDFEVVILVKHGELVGTEFQLKVWNASKKSQREMSGHILNLHNSSAILILSAVANACGANPTQSKFHVIGSSAPMEVSEGIVEKAGLKQK